jgi:hypothetical protein
MSITADFIRAEVAAQSYEISLHADDERLADGLTISQVEQALLSCEIIEHYPDDPRGESCLVVGFTPEAASVHTVCGKNRSGHLILITVYIPTMPKWRDPHTRNR